MRLPGGKNIIADRLDTISAAAIVILLLASLGLGIASREAPGVDSRRQAARAVTTGAHQENPEYIGHIVQIKEELKRNNLKKAEALLTNFLSQYPYEGEGYMLYGDLLLRQQNPLEAVLQYRLGFDLNPDYIDPKSAVSRGKMIRVNLKDALLIVASRLRQTPDDPILQEQQKSLFYIQRRLAGSCG